MGETYTIYKITGNGFVYVGMTNQVLSTRFRKHKNDAKQENCSKANKTSADIKALHRRLRDDSTKYRIDKIKTVTGSYGAHKEEKNIKSKIASVK